MAVKISQLSASTGITSDDFFPLVDSGSLTTQRASAQQILDYVTGSTFNALTVTSLTSSNVTGSTAQFTILTASNITGSTAMFTTLSSSNLIVSGGSAVIGDNAYVLYNLSIDKLAVFPGLYVTGAITASTIVNAPTGNFVVITGSTVTGTQAQFTSLTGTFVAPLGAVGTPSYTFIGDPNTGMFSPTADTLALVEGGTEVLRIDSSGRVGIGTAGVGGPAQTLDINGTMRLRTLVAGTNAGFGRNPATGDITALTSDQRLKKDINTITSSLDSISRLRGVTFKWDDTRFNDFIIEETEREKTQIGLIAQEVEAVLPELVYNNGIQDLKSVRYAELVAVLIEGIKELSQEVNNLKTEIQTLKSGSI
jgi:hypothetical protein